MSNIIPIYIEDEIKDSYLDYSMSVIVGRALPDVRDGLKPVHRRILFAMNEMGMYHDKPFKKSARIVGEVLGKYHPHGDTAVYDSMVRMAQNFSFRYPLINGHGNFGSVDGDSAAAMRYTEARMAKISKELLQDLEKNTIDFKTNFDESLEEPKVLPAKIPNLLINGSSGIAVGMATNIPPHNLHEIIDATIACIDNPDIEISDLMLLVSGPDFPTGGIINGSTGIHEAYLTGRGKIKLRGKTKFEDIKNGKEAIIVNEIPYQVNKSRLVEKIAELAKDRKITGITDLRDESDRDGIRVVIELKRGENAQIILNKLFKYTELEVTFGIIMLALVNNIPKVLNLKQILTEYIKHRYEVVVRRTRFLLDKAEKRAHILEGFRIALDNIDEIIKIIRGSRDSVSAKESLIERFKFSEVQAKAILDMRLNRLTGLEREKIDSEYFELLEEIKRLKEILADDEKVYSIIKTELLEVKETYKTERLTEIIENVKDINIEDMIKDEKVVVTITNNGYVKRMTLDKYQGQNRGGKGVNAHQVTDNDIVENMYLAKNLDTLMIFTDAGKVYSKKVYEIPEVSRQARGKLFSNLIESLGEEKIKAVIKVREFSEDISVLFVTRLGFVKKTKLSLFKNINKSGLIAINFKLDDNLIYAGLIEEENEVFITTKLGYCIRFREDNLRSIGRTAMGVKGITLRKKDQVVSGLVIKKNSKTFLTITKNGLGKRTPIEGYNVQNRGGKGIRNMKITEKTGEIVEVKEVSNGDQIMLISSNGILIRTHIEQIPVTSRVTSGVKVMKVADDVNVVSVVKINEKDLEE